MRHSNQFHTAWSAKTLENESAFQKLFLTVALNCAMNTEQPFKFGSFCGLFVQTQKSFIVPCVCVAKQNANTTETKRYGKGPNNDQIMHIFQDKMPQIK